MKTQSSNTLRLPILYALSCLALCPLARAFNPPPDGGYPGGNTAEGTSALSSLPSGFYNTGVGIYPLLTLPDGSFTPEIGAGPFFLTPASENTATGAGALLSNNHGPG